MIDWLSKSLDYLDFIRSKPCAVHGESCGRVDAAHLSCVGKGRSRKKPAYVHFSAVPLCRDLHLEQEGHTGDFNAKYNIDLWRYSQQLMIEFITGVEGCWRK